MRVISRTIRRKDTREVREHYAAPPAQLATAPRTIGLGDLAATFAQPIAALIDQLTDRFLSDEHRTALATCSACGRRHMKLNLLCPDVLACPALGQLLEILPTPARQAILAAAAKHARPPKG